MSEAAQPESHPFERLREAMKHLVTVPKKEVLRREKEAKDARKESRKP